MWRQKNNVASSSKVAPASAILGSDSDDDWETDPDYVNDMSEEQQRWGGQRDIGEIK